MAGAVVHRTGLLLEGNRADDVDVVVAVRHPTGGHPTGGLGVVQPEHDLARRIHDLQGVLEIDRVEADAQRLACDLAAILEAPDLLAPDADAGADLLARLDLWTFKLPGLAERREDIEPNLEFELDRVSEKMGTRITFNEKPQRRQW